jgi:hypothetical protein
MRFRGQFAGQQSCAAHVRFRSLADIAGGKIHVRFASDSGHQDGRDRCPLSAIFCREQMQQMASLLDHLVGEHQQRRRNVEAEPPYGHSTAPNYL